MKILLLNPPQVYNKGENPFVVFPLGLGYIAALLKEKNFDVKVLDCIGEGFNIKTQIHNGYLLGLKFADIRKRIMQIKPDIILISCLFSIQYQLVLRLASMIKSLNKDIKIVVGGFHVSALPEKALKNEEIDFVLMGEGELPTIKLAEAISKNKSFCKIRGIGYKKNNRIYINKKLDLVADLDKLPFPALDMFPIENYLNSNYKHTLLPSKRRTIEIITSRGCPIGCSFCASHVVSGKKWRARSVKNIIDEIIYLKKNYDIEEIHFLDDNLLLNKKRFEQLCKELTKLGLRWTMPNGIRISQLDKKLLALMRKSGCYALFLPIESANEKVLKNHLNKKISLAHAKSIVKNARKQRFYLIGFFLLGFFEETKKDINNTIKFASTLNLDEAHFSIITPLPGSEYYKKHFNKIDDFINFSAKKANLETKYLKKQEIEKLRDKAYLYFEFNKLIRRPLSYFSINQIKRLARYLRYFIRNF
ncbi:MAG: B12-binding domain-containing radical SAM protein [Candidatus Thorarchaeota archaeon]